MAFTSPQEITQLLRAWNGGDAAALEKLTPLVYQELHRLAHRHLAREQHDYSLQTSALVNEAYLRLVDAQQVDWQNRAHFFGVSARLMRQILVDFARQRDSQKRGGGVSVIGLEDTPNQGLDIAQVPSADLVALDDALNLLATLNPRHSQIVELRFFGGLGEVEIAEVLQVSERTVRSDWRMARAWLQRELSRA
ncbi:MAG: sigma-70 family RNA polymerase sigma factor [Acidobacteria bacterium]|nr:sigma-70 family RNA polymerase sigma factor [Acidobacteriota bacterium]MBI3422723.1 sigma-70 family RNA polymerase sigma factor [Acidobacteriota bacterium]